MCSYYANIKLVSNISTQGFAGMPWRIYSICNRLRVVPHFSSGIVKRAIFSLPAACRLFLAWGDFHARSRFARSTISEEKWGTTRSLYMQMAEDDNTLRATQNSTEYMNQVSGIRPKNSAGLGKSYRDTGYEIWLIPENRDSPSLVNRNHPFVNVYLYLKIHHE